MRRLYYLAFILVFSFSCTVDVEEEPLFVTDDTKYELIFIHNEAHLPYIKRHLIQYFIDVALGSEFGSDFQISKKWIKPMKLFLDGHPTEIHRNELNRIIEELNTLFSDGFQISLTESTDDANFFAYVGSLDNYRHKYFVPHSLDDQSVGYFFNESNSQFEIESGHMFVDTELTTLRLQKHLLREELTQALGLGNDLLYYVNSIFYSQWSDVTEYSSYDKETIRLLYHPRMLPALSEKSVRNQLKSILNID